MLSWIYIPNEKCMKYTTKRRLQKIPHLQCFFASDSIESNFLPQPTRFWSLEEGMRVKLIGLYKIYLWQDFWITIITCIIETFDPFNLVSIRRTIPLSLGSTLPSTNRIGEFNLSLDHFFASWMVCRLFCSIKIERRGEVGWTGIRSIGDET